MDLSTEPVQNQNLNQGLSSFDQNLTPYDFAALFGTTVEQLSEPVLKLIAKADFAYRKLSATEREQTLVGIFSRIDNGEFSLAGKEGKPRWDKGWQENLDAFVSNGHDLNQLVPKYIRPNQPIRLFQNYVMPRDPHFELNWYAVFRHWLFESFLQPYEAIYEFGCGSGFNVAELSRMYPNKSIFGMDWAQPSVQIVDEFAKRYGWKTQGKQFDFFEPDRSFGIQPNAAVLTIGALEQTGTNYTQFLEYLLAESPEICIHVEPIAEWYDPRHLPDYAARRFHLARHYWQGFPEAIAELARQGRVEVLKSKRSFFGSLYVEGYSQLIWRPLAQRKRWT